MVLFHRKKKHYPGGAYEAELAEAANALSISPSTGQYFELQSLRRRTSTVASIASTSAIPIDEPATTTSTTGATSSRSSTKWGIHSMWKRHSKQKEEEVQRSEERSRKKDKKKFKERFDRDVIIGGLTLVCTAARDIGDATNIGYLKGAAGLALLIIETTEGVRTCKSEVERLSRHIVELINAFINELDSNDGQLNPETLYEIESMNGKLERIHKKLREMLQGSYLSRLARQADDNSEIQRYIMDIKHYIRLFGIKQNMAVHFNLANFKNNQEDHQQAIMRIFNDRHKKQLTEIKRVIKDNQLATIHESPEDGGMGKGKGKGKALLMITDGASITDRDDSDSMDLDDGSVTDTGTIKGGDEQGLQHCLPPNPRNHSGHDRLVQSIVDMLLKEQRWDEVDCDAEMGQEDDAPCDDGDDQESTILHDEPEEIDPVGSVASSVAGWPPSPTPVRRSSEPRPDPFTSPIGSPRTSTFQLPSVPTPTRRFSSASTSSSVANPALPFYNTTISPQPSLSSLPSSMGYGSSAQGFRRQASTAFSATGSQTSHFPLVRQSSVSSTSSLPWSSISPPPSSSIPPWKPPASFASSSSHSTTTPPWLRSPTATSPSKLPFSYTPSSPHTPSRQSSLSSSSPSFQLSPQLLSQTPKSSPFIPTSLPSKSPLFLPQSPPQSKSFLPFVSSNPTSPASPASPLSPSFGTPNPLLSRTPSFQAAVDVASSASSIHYKGSLTPSRKSSLLASAASSVFSFTPKREEPQSPPPKPTSASRLAILGPKGIGKTSIIQRVMHHEDVEKQYIDRRIFVDCQAATDAEQILDCIIEKMAIQETVKGSDYQSIKGKLITFLNGGGNSSPTASIASSGASSIASESSTSVMSSEHPAESSKSQATLFVMDGLETAWQTPDTRTEVEALLVSLASLPYLALVITMTGTERPLSTSWSRPFLPPIPPLPLENALEMFEAISGQQNEPGIQEVVESCKGNPEAIRKVATQAQYTPLSSLMAQIAKQEQREFSAPEDTMSAFGANAAMQNSY